MAVLAVRLARVLAGDGVGAAQDVDALGNGLEVVGIEAVPYAAEMVEREVVGVRLAGELEGDAVNAKVAAAKRDTPIPKAGAAAAPEPATCDWVDIGALLEVVESHEATRGSHSSH
jgi:hypothetical protein